MKLIRASFEEFAQHVKQTNQKIVMFGAGSTGRVLIPYICNLYGLDERVLCYVDNNPAKQNRELPLETRKVKVVSDAYFHETVNEKFVILITNGDCGSVIEQLEQIEQLNDVECYLASVMQLMEKPEHGLEGIRKISEEPLIPKVIHYCWFSGNLIPENLQRCIDSWKEKCPDYEIVRWDESNYDVEKYLYTKQAYQAQKWGFIPDIARLEILYENGGFYLDTDVELIKSLDELRYQPAFCGREEWGCVNFGGGSGCVKHFGLVDDILQFRKDVPFLWDDGTYNQEASGYYETRPLIERGLFVKNDTEVIDDMTVYASEFFCPYNCISGTERITENTVSIHYFNGSWLGEEGKKHRMETRGKFDAIVSSMKPL